MAVEFEENDSPLKRYEEPQKSVNGMARWLVENNIAKDESGANKILVAVIIICFAAAAYFFFF